MPQRRKTSRELLNSQARKGRIKQREAEEAAALGLMPIPESNRWLSFAYSMECFLGEVGRERETFAARILPGQTVALELGARFNWRGDHLLTQAREHATREVVNNPPSTHRSDCEKFLKELSGDTEFILDPVACANIRTWLNVMIGSPNWTLTAEQNFYLVCANGWKKHDGTDRHGPRFWQSFTHRNVLAQGKKIVRDQL